MAVRQIDRWRTAVDVANMWTNRMLTRGKILLVGKGAT
jgi:hypothetical protein